MFFLTSQARDSSFTSVFNLFIIVYVAIVFELWEVIFSGHILLLTLKKVS